MKITLAKTAGFCFGVDRAVKMVENLVDSEERVCTLGPIIHNAQMVEELGRRGVRIVNDPEEVSAREILVIRSHGVERSVYDRAAERGVRVADATCPFVAKIHKIVAEHSAAGEAVLIAGDRFHQEVIGICGHCVGEFYVFSDEEELENLLQNHPEWTEKPLCVVAQTTFHEKKWIFSQKILKKVCTNAKIFDTICNATAMRQQEAADLASCHDGMVVIGGRHSSNTAKLFEVCKASCDRTVLVETAAELAVSQFSECRSVGVVAGASTPAGIIKEVIKTMSENLQPVDEQLEETVQKSFEEMTDEEALEASLQGLTGEQKVCGTVLAVNASEIQVDIGRGLAGYITASEYSLDPSVKLTEEVKVGDQLNLIIMKINDQEGTVMLSKRRYDAIAGWDRIVAAKDSNEIITGTIHDVVKGGVVAYVDNVRVFIPASQATASRNDSLEDLKGKEVQFRIIEIGRGRKAVGSIRSVLREQRREAQAKLWETIAVGDRFKGVVKSLTTYGAFVDIGGVDGMVHISELSWQRIKNPAEVVSVGDEIEVYVKAIDTEKKKISLGYKNPEENPWTIFQNNYNVDDVVTVKIVSITSYGAFARVIPGIDGLIHISQIANKHIEKPQDELTVGQEVDVKITAVDLERKRVSLSIRALLPEEPKPEKVEEETTSDEPVVIEIASAEDAAAAADALVEEAPEVVEEAAPVVEEPVVEEPVVEVDVEETAEAQPEE